MSENSMLEPVKYRGRVMKTSKRSHCNFCKFNKVCFTKRIKININIDARSNRKNFVGKLQTIGLSVNLCKKCVSLHGKKVYDCKKVYDLEG